MTQIYIMNINEAGELSEEYCLKHFPERTRTSQKFRFRDDKLRCLAAGVLLFEILGLEDDDIITGEYGKPYSEKIEKYFNISHSGKYTVISVSDSLTGVDIERIDACRDNIAKRVFTRKELALLTARTDAQKKSESFYKLWTLKESAVKAVGKGLAVDPGSFDVLDILSGKSIVLENSRLFGSCFVFDGHALSVCTEHREKPCVFIYSAQSKLSVPAPISK